MKIHWMDNQINIPINKLKELSDICEDVGYESILLTFHSESHDNWIKAAAAIVPGNKLKYMIALRPYHLSPQYCAMMIEGFNSISPNRLMINFVAGDIQNRSDESDQKDIFRNSKKIETVSDRKKFVRDFVSDLKKSSVITKMPEFVFSGFSPYTVETAKMYDGIGLSMIDDYDKNKNLFNQLNRKMVCVKMLVRDSNEEAEKALNSVVNRPREKDFTIFGNEKTIFEKLAKMEKDGVTDVLVHYYNNDLSSDSVHSAMKKFILLNGEK
jgi:alkanesulfonate monooxygenase SsuD/methylene tetrahydromethanopterin reductase-like flavin-dependent oxidoreductase (luciferase family)